MKTPLKSSMDVANELTAEARTIAQLAVEFDKREGQGAAQLQLGHLPISLQIETLRLWLGKTVPTKHTEAVEKTAKLEGIELLPLHAPTEVLDAIDREIESAKADYAAKVSRRQQLLSAAQTFSAKLDMLNHFVLRVSNATHCQNAWRAAWEDLENLLESELIGGAMESQKLLTLIEMQRARRSAIARVDAWLENAPGQIAALKAEAAAFAREHGIEVPDQLRDVEAKAA